MGNTLQSLENSILYSDAALKISKHNWPFTSQDGANIGSLICCSIHPWNRWHEIYLVLYKKWATFSLRCCHLKVLWMRTWRGKRKLDMKNDNVFVKIQKKGMSYLLNHVLKSSAIPMSMVPLFMKRCSPFVRMKFLLRLFPVKAHVAWLFSLPWNSNLGSFYSTHRMKLNAKS